MYSKGKIRQQGIYSGSNIRNVNHYSYNSNIPLSLSLQLVCAVLAGVLHFLFLSTFVWMFIEAVLLYISVKNLSQPVVNQREVLNWKILTAVAYTTPLVVVGVSAAVLPSAYGSEQ